MKPLKTKNRAVRNAVGIGLSALLLAGCGADEAARSAAVTNSADARVRLDGVAPDAGVPEASAEDAGGMHSWPADAGAADASNWDAANADVAVADGGWGVPGDGAARSLTAVVHDYVDAWNARDEARRRALLGSSFAAAGEYTDPGPTHANRAELVAVIGSFQAIFPNGQLVATSAVDGIDNQFRFTWKVVAANGSTAQTGEDQGEVGKDGLIRRITGFFDPDPTGSTPAAVAALTTALSATDATARSQNLGAAVTSGIVWSDRWMGAIGTTELEAHLNDWVPPGTSTFTITGGIGQHDDRFRVTYQVAGGKVSANSQMFGHLDPTGLIDVAIFFDGDLPAP